MSQRARGALRLAEELRNETLVAHAAALGAIESLGGPLVVVCGCHSRGRSTLASRLAGGATGIADEPAVLTVWARMVPEEPARTALVGDLLPATWHAVPDAPVGAIVDLPPLDEPVGLTVTEHIGQWADLVVLVVQASPGLGKVELAFLSAWSTRPLALVITKSDQVDIEDLKDVVAETRQLVDASGAAKVALVVAGLPDDPPDAVAPTLESWWPLAATQLATRWTDAHVKSWEAWHAAFRAALSVDEQALRRVDDEARNQLQTQRREEAEVHTLISKVVGAIDQLDRAGLIACNRAIGKLRSEYIEALAAALNQATRPDDYQEIDAALRAALDTWDKASRRDLRMAVASEVGMVRALLLELTLLESHLAGAGNTSLIVSPRQDTGGTLVPHRPQSLVAPVVETQAQKARTGMAWVDGLWRGALAGSLLFHFPLAGLAIGPAFAVYNQAQNKEAALQRARSDWRTQALDNLPRLEQEAQRNLEERWREFVQELRIQTEPHIQAVRAALTEHRGGSAVAPRTKEDAPDARTQQGQMNELRQRLAAWEAQWL